MCAMNSTRSHWNEDFAEAAGVAKPISTGSGGSGYVRDYRGSWVDCEPPQKTSGSERTVLQATWIYKLGKNNLGNLDCQVGRDLVPSTCISKLNHELLGDEPLENLETWIHVSLYKHARILARKCTNFAPTNGFVM
jgi:hypothetical protein